MIIGQGNQQGLEETRQVNGWRKKKEGKWQKRGGYQAGLRVRNCTPSPQKADLRI